ncbi:hypothetical protein PR048_013603 [Dryococelus australis]|uniref:HAT C-terminal dimerisation domain-containing protein n=1 Tax=Dryococelus australis TaxID=614101 RepID=A0ABQ9HSM6_9NEOP|nr:hypothetical protein PR048_013603 [Dryococelus australis]
MAVSLLKERFELVENHSKSFKFLYDIENLQTGNRKELKDACTHLHSVLSYGEECDINGIALFGELQIFAPMLPSGSSPAKALSFLTKNGYMDTFSNIFVTLRILLTLPVSVTSGKRSFSKLKLIKIYFKINFVPRMYSLLAIMAIENDLLKEMDTDLILNEFAKMKARKICL